MLNLFLENMLLFYSSEIGIERKSNENLGISLSFPLHNLENVLLAWNTQKMTLGTKSLSHEAKQQTVLTLRNYPNGTYKLMRHRVDVRSYRSCFFCPLLIFPIFKIYLQVRFRVFFSWFFFSKNSTGKKSKKKFFDKNDGPKMWRLQRRSHEVVVYGPTQSRVAQQVGGWGVHEL